MQPIAGVNAMASLIKRGGTYYVAWRERDGRQRRKSLETSSQIEARKRLQVWTQKLGQEIWQTEKKNPTVEEFARAYGRWAEHHHKRKTRETELQRWQVFIDWHKPKRLGDVTRQDIQRFKLHLLESGMSKVTVNNYLRDIQALFGHAIKTFELYSGGNPVKGVERLKEEESPPPYLTLEQIDKLVEAARAHSREMHWFCMLGIYAGLRYAEIGNCRWEWLDWERKLLHIPSDETFSLKSHRGRSIPLNNKLIKVLKTGAQEAGYLFESGKPTEGKSHYRYDPRKAFNAVRDAAGLDWVTPHTLRHTFGTQLGRANVSPLLIKEWMGHQDIKVTMRYAHVQGYSPDINRF
jgi:integrase